VSATVKRPGPRRRRVRSAAWLAWGPSLLVVAVLLVTLVLFELPDETRPPAKKLSDLVLGAYPNLGVCGRRRSDLVAPASQRIGWLCWAIGFTWSVASLGSDPAARRVAVGPVTIPAAMALQLRQVAFLLSLLGLLPLLVLLFPTGRLASRRCGWCWPSWRPSRPAAARPTATR